MGEFGRIWKKDTREEIVDIQSKHIFASTMVHVHIWNSLSPPDVLESNARK